MQMSQDMEINQAKCLKAIETAALNGAELIVFPEIQYTPFFPKYEKLDVEEYAMTIDHPFVSALQEMCRRYKIMAAPNFYLSENGHMYDATTFINTNGDIIGTQKMVHIAQTEGFYEQDYYTPADTGFKVFDTELGKIGCVVCFDRHYPESIRTEALKGADLIVIPTANTVGEPSDMFAWEIRVQAFQSSVAIAMCNRVGIEDDTQYCGESIVVDPSGNVLAFADNKEQIVYAEIDMQGVKKIRDSKTYTQLRRKELYI